MKFQITNNKFQINSNFEFRKSVIIYFLTFRFWILFVICYLLFGFLAVNAASNILDDDLVAVPHVYNHWAWNNVIGWIDFQINDGNPDHKNVNVRADRLDGYAYNSSIGYIQLNCNTPVPGGGVADCKAAGDWKVINSPDASGNNIGFLSGWAWNDQIGWISFNYNDTGASSNYNVTIGNDGEFQGFAWNNIIGWISFNCANDACVGSGKINYKTKTNQALPPVTGNLTSSVIDTGSDNGVSLNSVIWRGYLHPRAMVKFQIASSNTVDNGGQPWSFLGPNQDPLVYYQANQPAAPGFYTTTVSGHINKRYFRYKIFLETDSSQIFSPRVDDVIINYSP